MPKSLRLYIAGVVVLSAVALVAATLVFPADERIALDLGLSGPSADQIQILLGVACWTILTLITSALPVRLPLGSHHAVSMAPVIAAMTLGGPAVGGWVAGIGTTEMRELRGEFFVWHPGEPRRRRPSSGRSRDGQIPIVKNGCHRREIGSLWISLP
jgi:hypothetical protein